MPNTDGITVSNKPVKFGGHPEKDNTEPSSAEGLTERWCRDYRVAPKAYSARKTGCKPWTDREMEIIGHFYNGEYENASIFDLLPSRSEQAIRHKLSRLGYKDRTWEGLRNYNELTDSECAYIAGILDGEGHIRRVKPKPFRQVSIAVSNTNLKLVNWLHDKLGGGSIRELRSRPNHSQCYQWYLTRYINCVNLLDKVKPYLIIKKEIAEDIVRTAE